MMAQNFRWFGECPEIPDVPRSRNVATVARAQGWLNTGVAGGILDGERAVIRSY